jgi:ABC-type uncharacterized transport system involved in gliding motility auxiliary subunit
MRVDRRARILLRLEAATFAVLLVIACGLLGWLGQRYELRADWSRTSANTLSEPTERVLERLEGPVRITAYARDSGPLRHAIRNLVERFRRTAPGLSLEFVDPDRAPDRVRELGVTHDGELIAEYQQRTAHVLEPTERALTNGLLRLLAADERWVVYVTGHGERDLLGQANHDLGRFGAQLQRRGYRVQGVELARTGSVPDNTSVLVVSAPAVSLLPVEVRALVEWIEGGGNLLWLGEPNAGDGLAALGSALGVTFVPGTIVEPRTQDHGLDSPLFALATSYPSHPATRGFQPVTLYPMAAGVRATPPEGWRAAPLALSGPQAWSESGPLEGEVGFDQGQDVAGPLQLVVALERELAARARDGVMLAHRQRIVITGDGDFLSDTYLGNSGNLDLGLALLHWLAGDDELVGVSAQTAPDARLELSRTQVAIMALVFLILTPLAFVGAGVGVWLRRRRR